MQYYRSFACRALGANHEKSGLVCQDYSLCYDDVKTSIAIVADGHGSPQYFRSNIGSRFVSEVALAGIRELVQENPFELESDNEKEHERILHGLARYIISSWFDSVDADEKSNPLCYDPKTNQIENKYKDRYLNDIHRQYFCHAYGTTLIAVAIMENYWFGLQIGDGKCAVLFDDGTWEQPIPWDDKCFLNTTTSICDEDSISEFRYWFGSRKDGRTHNPVAMFVGTDGVDDTFPVHENERHLKGLYRSILLSFAKDGFESAVSQVAEFLPSLSKRGSGDDVSIAGIVCIPLPKEIVDVLTKEDVLERENEKGIEACKKAEAKLQVVQDVQTKIDDQRFRIKSFQKIVDNAVQNHSNAKTEVDQLKEGLVKVRRATEKAERKEQQALKEYQEAQSELVLAEDELKRQMERLFEVETERKEADEYVSSLRERKEFLERELLLILSGLGERIEKTET